MDTLKKDKNIFQKINKIIKEKNADQEIIKSNRSGQFSKRDTIKNRKSNLTLIESERLLRKHLNIESDSIHTEQLDQQENQIKINAEKEN